MGILDEEEDPEVEDRSSEDEDDEYTTPYWEKNWINNDGDNGTRKSKKSKKQKGASKKTRKYDEQRRRKEDISITMSGFSLIFCLFVMVVCCEIVYGYFNSSYTTKSVQAYNIVHSSAIRFYAIFPKPDTVFQRLTRFH